VTKKSRQPGAEQQAAFEKLTAIAREGQTPLMRAELLDGRAESFDVEVELRTEDLERADGALNLADREIFRLRIPRAFPWGAPQVSVEHDRFVGFAHVLQGSRICVFLDEDQEWGPGMGIAGFLEELYRWLRDAAAGRFDASTALFHPVGGVVHRTPGCPTIVVRRPIRFDAGPIQRLGLRGRSEQRLDLVGEGDSDAPIVAVHVPAPLSYGAGTTVGALLVTLDMLQFPPVQGVLTALGAAASRVAPSSPVYFLLAVAPARDRPDLARHLIAGRLPAEVAVVLRDALPDREPIRLTDPALAVPIEWCDVSEERVEVTNRRDSRRPTRHLDGIHAVVWGCGGLGSWIAEFLTRAGVARLSVCDRPTPIHGGLLVRQDLVELDLGRPKAEAVASRALAIRDDLEVEVLEGLLGIDVVTRSLPGCELLVDATVNRSVAELTELVWPTSSPSITVARVFVDRPSSSLGVATIARPTGPSLAAIEQRAEGEVRSTGALEPFRVFWDPPASSDEILAEPGCSVPTFHGSAADLAAMGGVFMTLIASHLETELVGCHLISLPYAPSDAPKHHWIAG
jgi:ThiF family/Prokaryotic E2 family A